MDPRNSKETTPVSSASEESSARLLPPKRTNENWRGKNDPAERRRIQNRINQRAFRQRRRAGEASKPYKPRNSSGSSSRQRQTDDEALRRTSLEEHVAATPSISPTAGPSSLPNPSASGSTSSAAANTPVVAVEWDELGHLINRNFMSAAADNAALIGLDVEALRRGVSVMTPRPSTTLIPAPLHPVDLQFQLAHDPIIDIIPHPRFRHNILRAIHNGQIEPTEFLRTLRASGSFESGYGPATRAGLVVWSFPAQLASWELSESFVRKYAFLLQGCEDLLAATNAWRSQRNEQPLELPQGIV